MESIRVQVDINLVDNETERPATWKQMPYGFVDLPRNTGEPKKPLGPPRITGFGLVVKGHVSSPESHRIQANHPQASEVISQAGWAYSAEIQNVGATVSFPAIFAYII